MKKRIMIAIRSHFRDHEFTVDSLAEYLNISRSYLRELTKSYFGMGPQKLIETIRLEAALDLVSDTGSVYSIHNLVGYKNERTFRYAFKKRLGVCCSSFREILTGNDGMGFEKFSRKLWRYEV